MTNTEKSLSVPELETVYDALATAIDQVGRDKANLLLVKLALLNANALGSPAFHEHLQTAAKDL